MSDRKKQHIITQDNLEAQWANQLKARDRAVMEQLYDAYGKVLYGIILRIVGEHVFAEDVMQEVFLKIWRHATTFDPQKGRLFTWMLNISRNAAIDFIRKKNRKHQLVSEIKQGSNFAETSVYKPSIDYIGIKEIVNRLKPEYKCIIDLMYFAGFSQSEIAKELELPLGTVKTRSRAAIRELRKIVCT